MSSFAKRSRLRQQIPLKKVGLCDTQIPPHYSTSYFNHAWGRSNAICYYIYLWSEDASGHYFALILLKTYNSLLKLSTMYCKVLILCIYLHRNYKSFWHYEHRKCEITNA